MGEPDAVGLGVPLDVSLGVAVTVGVAVGDSDAVELGVPVGLADPVGVGEPVQVEEAGALVVSTTAWLGLAGTTNSVPIATVPVATAPTIDAADRFLRACFGTVQTPSFRRFPCNSEHAPRGTHHATVTNDP